MADLLTKLREIDEATIKAALGGACELPLTDAAQCVELIQRVLDLTATEDDEYVEIAQLELADLFQHLRLIE